MAGVSLQALHMPRQICCRGTARSAAGRQLLDKGNGIAETLLNGPKADVRVAESVPQDVVRAAGHAVKQVQSAVAQVACDSTRISQLGSGFGCTAKRASQAAQALCGIVCVRQGALPD